MAATLNVGTMNFGARTDAAESTRIVERALERGLTVFDTANFYGDGASEKILGAALKGRGRVGTKVGIWKREGLGKARVLAAIDESLTRLGLDRVDLYTLHAPDPKTPFEETLDAIAQLLEAGKIRAWGVSNFAAWQIAELDLRCDARKLARPQTSQVLYNLLVRQLDVEYFAFTRAHPIHTAVYNPLAGGLLARAPEPGAAIPSGSRFAANALYRSRYWTELMLARCAAYQAIARAQGLSLLTLAYAWLAGHPGVGSIVCGPASVAHLDAAIDGCAVELAPAVRAELDAVHLAAQGTDARYAR